MRIHWKYETEKTVQQYISYQMGVGPFVDRNPVRQVKMWDNIGGEVEGDFRQGGKNVKTKLTKVNTSCVCM